MAADPTVEELKQGCVAAHVGEFKKGFGGNPDVERYKASIFIKHITKGGKGHEIWKNSKVSTEVFNTKEEAEQAGRRLAASFEIPYLDDFGSLHNKKVAPKVSTRHHRAVRLRSGRHVTEE